MHHWSPLYFRIALFKALAVSIAAAAAAVPAVAAAALAASADAAAECGLLSLCNGACHMP